MKVFGEKKWFNKLPFISTPLNVLNLTFSALIYVHLNISSWVVLIYWYLCVTSMIVESLDLFTLHLHFVLIKVF